MFACRYLIDKLAAGHIRTPRRAIYETIKKNTKCRGTTRLILSNLLAKEMHDEDSRKGVMVEYEMNYFESFEGVDMTGNTKPKKILGEACYFENEKQKVDWANLREIIVAGLFDIFYYYFSEKKNKQIKYSALELFPIIRETETKPLFQVDNTHDKLMVRKNVANTACCEYVSDWNPIDLLFQKKLTSIQQVNHQNPELAAVEKDMLEKELQQLDSANALFSFFAQNPQLGMYAKGILNIIEDYAEECHVTCRLM